MTAEQVVRLHYQYFNERRLDEAVALIDPEAVFHTLPTRQHLMGVAGYRAMVAAWLHAFADARLEIQTLVVRDTIADVDFLGSGTHTGDLVLGDALSVPATGLAIELPFHDRLEIRDGHIVRAELDFDEQALRRHLLSGR
jgi:ketosteroid isomerase-like protein